MSSPALDASAVVVDRAGATAPVRSGRPDVAVVVVTFESRREVGRCLGSIEGAAPGVALETWVVDNASRDGTADYVASAFPRVRLRRNSRNLGFASAANAAIRASRGRHVLLLNPDAWLEPRALERLLRYLDMRPEVGIAGARIYDDESRRSIQPSCRSFPTLAQALFHRGSLATRLLPTNPWSRRYLRSDFDHARAQPVDWVAFSCALARRAVFEEIGLLDEGFFLYCEDVDFCRRARKAGLGIHYVSEAECVHPGGRSARSARLRSLVARHRSLWRYYRKHMGGPARLLAPAVLAGLFGRAALQFGLLGASRLLDSRDARRG